MPVCIYLRVNDEDNTDPVLPFRRSVYFFLSKMGSKWELDEQFDYDECHYKAKAADVRNALTELVNTKDIEPEDVDDYTEFYVPAYQNFINQIVKYSDDEYIYFTKA